MSRLIITIDGPTASGKSTTANKLAEKLGIYHLKGGTFLRSLTYYCLKHNILSHDRIAMVASSLPLIVDSENCIVLEGKDVSGKLWTPEVDKKVSEVSGIADVRKHRKNWLRNVANRTDLVADGRTLGSEIFPEAQFKFNLTANITTRAKRRHEQYESQLSYQEVLASINERDESDKHGALDRSIPPKDSILINSSDLSVSDVVNLMIEYIQNGEN